MVLSDLPVGTILTDNETTYNGHLIYWLVLEHGHTGDPVGSTTLKAYPYQYNKPILDTSNFEFDAPESSNPDSARKSGGNNRWSLSNIRQFLNADGSNWYSAAHEYDAQPSYVSYDGFLTDFSTNLKNALMTRNSICALGVDSYTDENNENVVYEVSQEKVFLLSDTETRGNQTQGVNEGSQYAYYTTDFGVYKTTSGAYPAQSHLRSMSDANNGSRIKFLNGEGLYDNQNGLANKKRDSFLAVCIPSNTKVSNASIDTLQICVEKSTNNNSWYKTVPVYLLFDETPEITAPDSLGDKNGAFNMTFSAEYNVSGTTLSATISIDQTEKQTIDPLTKEQSYTFAVDAQTFRSLSIGSHNIVIDVESSDGKMASKTIPFQRVASNVTISGTDGDIGSTSFAPTITYQVGDSAGTQVNIVEKIDNVTTRTLTDVELNTNITFDLSNFSQLQTDATHTCSIIATNADGSTATRTYTFTRLNDSLIFMTNPISTDAAAKKINVLLDYKKVGNPNVTIEVSNNASAIVPVWENATSRILQNKAYYFVNEPATGFGISVKVTIEKNANTGQLEVYSIGLSFA